MPSTRRQVASRCQADSDHHQKLPEVEVACLKEVDEHVAIEGSLDENAMSDSDETNGSNSCSSSEQELPALNILERRARDTAGQNNTIREGKEMEDDEAFWNHADLREASSDSDIEFSTGALERSNDSGDSDFDASEDPKARDDEEAAKVQEPEPEQERKKRPTLYIPGKTFLRKPAPKRTVARTATAVSADSSKRTPHRAIRESTRQQTAETEARVVSRSDVCTSAPRQRHLKPKLTQQQRLEAAVETEAKNLKEFQAMRICEDELRQQSRQQYRRKRYQGPRTCFLSRLHENGHLSNVVEFIGCDLPEVLQTGSQKPAPAPCCNITGLPARYRDPATGIPFATIEAYKEITRRRQIR